MRALLLILRTWPWCAAARNLASGGHRSRSAKEEAMRRRGGGSRTRGRGGQGVGDLGRGGARRGEAAACPVSPSSVFGGSGGGGGGARRAREEGSRIGKRGGDWGKMAGKRERVSEWGCSRETQSEIDTCPSLAYHLTSCRPEARATASASPSPVRFKFRNLDFEAAFSVSFPL
jgi:hypothetical protein